MACDPNSGNIKSQIRRKMYIRHNGCLMAARYCLNITFIVFSTAISNILWSIKNTFKVSNLIHFKHKLLHKYLSDILLGLLYCAKVQNEIKFHFGVNCNILHVDTNTLIFLYTTQNHSRNIFNRVKKVLTLKRKIKLWKLEENVSPLHLHLRKSLII